MSSAYGEIQERLCWRENAGERAGERAGESRIEREREGERGREREREGERGRGGQGKAREGQGQREVGGEDQEAPVERRRVGELWLPEVGQVGVPLSRLPGANFSAKNVPAKIFQVRFVGPPLFMEKFSSPHKNNVLTRVWARQIQDLLIRRN